MKRLCTARSALMLLTAVSISWMTASDAQIQTTDEVGIVFPAFFADTQGFGEGVALMMKLAVQSQFRLTDPTTDEGGYGLGIARFVPVALDQPSHDAAIQLARSYGLQGTVWGQAVELVDGLTIQSFLTLDAEFDDSRLDRLEYWSVNFNGVTFRLGPPEQRVSFISETIPKALTAQFLTPSSLKYCSEDGSCQNFDSNEVSLVFNIDSEGIATVRRDDVDYKVQLPQSSLLYSQVIDYSSLFLSYARGNFNYTEILARRFVEIHGASSTAVDAHLYRAAALARMGQFDEARVSVNEALQINPFARRALRYGIMIEFAAEQSISASGARMVSDRARELFATLEANFLITSDFDKLVAELIRTSEQEVDQDYDIVDTAVSAGNLSTLVAAVQAVGLVETLKSAGPFTIFAPTDSAFAALPAGTVEDLLKPENKEQLVAILTYHIVPGKVMSTDLLESLTASTVQGGELTITHEGGTQINGANIVQADISTTNGIIHVIDAVILPPM